ncbi:MAG TPA: enoyl-CoA hydratase/isomerase family protein [Methylomirabilota bacterium]|nr:enoyl-CoA hydratase/isomerase family protein [Methylomirabilota bacterium]
MSASLTMDGAIARLTLERPEALNALNRDVAAALEDSLGRLERARDVSVVVLSGRGRAFCAGNDIAEMPALSPTEAEALSQRWQDIMDRFARLPQATIAAVHGYALGGGCMLAAAQDLRIAEAGAHFGLPEITLGFNPSYGIARLLDILDGAHARELLLTGRIVDAGEALRMGLVTRVVPDGTLDRAAADFAAEIARNPRGGLAATKAIVADIRAGRPGDAAQAYAAALRADPEARARIAAFVKRKNTER